jgi:hypothetical protein
MPKQEVKVEGMLRTLVLNLSRFLHLKRQTQYWIIGTAKAQSALKEGDAATVYADKFGNLHVREYTEFHDGRFKKESD